MSKKKSKKFKKINNKAAVIQTNSESATKVDNQELIEQVKKTENPKHDEVYLNNEYAHVRRDMRKVTITMSFIILLAIGAYFLNSETAYLKDLGNWIYRISNIQTQ